MPLNLIFTQPGDYVFEDNDNPGDNTSWITSGGLPIFTMAHPADSLSLTCDTPGCS